MVTSFLPAPARQAPAVQPLIRRGAVAEELCAELCRIGAFERVALYARTIQGAPEKTGSWGRGDTELERLGEGRRGADPQPFWISPYIWEALGQGALEALEDGRLYLIPLPDRTGRDGFFLAHRPVRGPETGVDREAIDDLARMAAIALRAAGTPVGLARHLHDTVGQRLAGMSFLLAAGDHLGTEEDRRQLLAEVSAALDELRDGLEGPLGESRVGTATSVEREIKAFRREHPRARLDWTPAAIDSAGARCPLIETVVAEGLRNARRHAVPTFVSVEVRTDPRVTMVTVRNDGADGRRKGGCGMGLRLLGVEASMAGGLMEATYEEDGCWRLQLILPSIA